MKKIIYYALTVMLLASCSNNQTIHFVDVSDFSEVQQLAQEADKPIFLYAWTSGNEISGVIESQVFTDEKIYTYFNEHFINYSIDASAEKWSDIVTRYGFLNYPVMLFLTPQGEILNDITGLGKIGYDEMGGLPCRNPILRHASIASSFVADNDSVFFLKDNWKKIDQSFIRLDSKLFERIMLNKDLLRERYNKGFDVLVDFSMSAAAINLVIKEKDQAPRRNEYRINVYNQILERYEIDNEARYKLYADVNVAYGMNDLTEAARVADEAYQAGTITETEYRQLKYNMGVE